jgi:hypothetical protein
MIIRYLEYKIKALLYILFFVVSGGFLFEIFSDSFMEVCNIKGNLLFLNLSKGLVIIIIFGHSPDLIPLDLYLERQDKGLF